MSADRNLVETMDHHSPVVFGQKLISAKRETIGNGTSRGAERRKFQLRSTFQRGIKLKPWSVMYICYSQSFMHSVPQFHSSTVRQYC